MKEVFIYGLIDPRNGQLRYVGKSIDPKRRLLWHKKTTNMHMVNWLNLLSKESLKPEMHILEISNENEWIEDERFWIQYMKFLGCNLINMKVGGEGPNGWGHISDETKRKISIANKGRKMSEETKSKMIKTLTGRKLNYKITKEIVNKRNNTRNINNPFKRFNAYGNHGGPIQMALFRWGNTGNKHSEESKDKISKSRTGIIASFGENHGASKLKIQDVRNILKIRNLGMKQYDICKIYGVHQSVISKILTGKRWKHALECEVGCR